MNTTGKEIKNWPTEEEMRAQAKYKFPDQANNKNQEEQEWRREWFVDSCRWLKSQLQEPAEEGLDEYGVKKDNGREYLIVTGIPTPPQPVKEEEAGDRQDGNPFNINSPAHEYWRRGYVHCLNAAKTWQSSSFSASDMGEELKYLRAEFEANIDKVFTKTDMEGFLDWASLNCFNKFMDKRWMWGYKEKARRISFGWLTTSQLLTEYLNSPEYKNKKI